MNNLIHFLASSSGRMARVAAGLALIIGGLFAVGGTAGIVIAAVGLVPMAAGVFDLCLFAPLFHLPLQGGRIRSHV